MPDALTDAERKVLSYCYRGTNKSTAEEHIATFFAMQPMDVRATIDKLRRQGLLIESKGIAGVSVYQASPIKVRAAMIDQRVVEQLKEMERGGKAAGFKKRTFDPDTGIVSDVSKPKPAAKKTADLGFDVE
jgi:hypothetical protein